MYPQLPKSYPITHPVSEASSEILRSLEIAIQISSSLDYNTLSINEISEICQLKLPSLDRDLLYSSWHHVWFELSKNGGKFYLPQEFIGSIDDFLALHPCQKSGHIPDKILKSRLVLRTLHMMIVEWIVHYPGFNCRGMELGEALDFFCEKAGLDILEFDSFELKVEHSIKLIELLFSTDYDI